MNDEIQTRFVIGGPARCGKTTLSTAIADTDESCFVLGVDALFRAILRRGIVNRVTPVADTVAHFLTRQRFQDAERSIAESPLDYSPLDLDALIGASTGANPVTAYASALDAMAVAAGKRHWATFDLHPEFAYPRLRRLIPGLKLAVMFRDPAEAIAAVLYWRRDGKPLQHSRREFRRALILWAIAATAALSHRRRWPQDVRFVTLPELMESQTPVSVFGISARHDTASGTSHDALHFRRTADGYRQPAGGFAPLLSAEEEAEVAALLHPLAHAVGLETTIGAHGEKARPGLKLYAAILTSVARVAPQGAANLMDFLDAPLGVTRRRLSLVRQALTTCLRGNTAAGRPA